MRVQGARRVLFKGFIMRERKYRVGIFCERDRGIPSHPFDMAYILAREGYEVEVIAARGEEDIKYYFNSGFKIRVLNLANKKIKRLRTLEFLIRSIVCAWNRRFDIVIATGTLTFLAAHILKRMKRAGILVYYAIELSLPQEQGADFSIAYQYRLSKEADIVVATGQHRAKVMKEQFRLFRFPLVIENCPLYYEYGKNNQLREIIEKKGSKPKFIVIYQGGLNQHRCVLEMIESVASWEANAALVILGYGGKEYIMRIEEAIKNKGLENKIFYLGWLSCSREELLKMTSGADLGLAFHRWRGLNMTYATYWTPNKAYDYIACGIPTIASDNPSLNFVQEEGLGVCVDPQDPSAIASAVNRILQDANIYKNMREKANIIFKEKYNYQKQTEPFLQELEELIFRTFKMQVIVSVGGRFHGFYLTRQLFIRGCLKRIITSYPKFSLRKYGIPANKARSAIMKEIIERLYWRLPAFIRDLWNPQYFTSRLFDKLASREIDKADIFVGWSGSSLTCLRKAKQLGALTILERGSSHILLQQDILKEEFDRFGLKFNGAHPKIIERELKEYEEADYIEVPSSFAKQTFVEYGVKETKIILGSMGVDLTEFRPIPKKDNTFRVVCSGLLSLRKGTHYLLQAFCELNLPDAELWLIGKISEEIRPFLRKYDNGKVFCMGPFIQNQMYRYYSQGSVFILMSIEEGLAVVQLQAAACGLPIICTTNTGGEDIVRDGIDGFVIPIRDVAALKQKLAYLYKNPGICLDMGRSILKRVSDNFTWDSYGENIVKSYRNVLEYKI